jgi:rhodanese-related sulfurtransferase
MRIVTLLMMLAAFGAGCEAPASQIKTEPSAAQEIVRPVGLVVKNTRADQAPLMLKDNPQMIVLDVRTAKEFNEGHIEGAINIDFHAPDFEDQISELSRDVPYLVHCRSGRRSTLALETLKTMEFTDITHLDGGVKAWTSAGLNLTDPCLREC